MDSILNFVKKNIGISEDDDNFDEDIIGNINTSLSFLYRMGVPAPQDFVVNDETTAWTDYLPDIDKYSYIKTYVWLKAKLVFDPPASSTIIESYKSTLSEIEFSIDNDFNYTNQLGVENSK